MESWSANLLAPPERRGSEHDYVQAVVGAAVAEGSNGTGIFGLRLQQQSFDFLLGKLALLHPGQMSDADRFRAAFGRTLFIHLTRADKIAQAVSCVKAQQTGLWHVAADGSALERLKEYQEPVYDGIALRRSYDEMVESDSQWFTWFASQGIEPLRLSYDRLSADPLAVLREALRALWMNEGVANGVAVGVKKLSDNTNRDWAQRLRTELGST